MAWPRMPSNSIWAARMMSTRATPARSAGVTLNWRYVLASPVTVTTRPSSRNCWLLKMQSVRKGLRVLVAKYLLTFLDPKVALPHAAGEPGGALLPGLHLAHEQARHPVRLRNVVSELCLLIRATWVLSGVWRAASG